jgi:hypothetical protein
MRPKDGPALAGGTDMARRRGGAAVGLSTGSAFVHRAICDLDFATGAMTSCGIVGTSVGHSAIR